MPPELSLEEWISRNIEFTPIYRPPGVMIAQPHIGVDIHEAVEKMSRWFCPKQNCQKLLLLDLNGIDVTFQKNVNYFKKR